MLYLCADVVTRVNDFNFTHVTFLTRLRDADLKALSSSDTQMRRRMFVQLDIQRSNGSQEYRLIRCLNRTQHPAKSGVCVHLSYTVTCRSAPMLLIVGQRLRQLKRYIRGDKKQAELQKIVRAVEQQAHPGISWPGRDRRR